MAPEEERRLFIIYNSSSNLLNTIGCISFILLSKWPKLTLLGHLNKQYHQNHLHPNCSFEDIIFYKLNLHHLCVAFKEGQH